VFIYGDLVFFMSELNVIARFCVIVTVIKTFSFSAIAFC